MKLLLRNSFEVGIDGKKKDFFELETFLQETAVSFRKKSRIENEKLVLSTIKQNDYILSIKHYIC